MLLHVSVGHSLLLPSSIPLTGSYRNQVFLSPAGGHLDGLQLGAVWAKAVINIHV